jgi:hypothetical protein
MFLTLVDTWKETCSPALVAEKVRRRLFNCYWYILCGGSKAAYFYPGEAILLLLQCEQVSHVIPISIAIVRKLLITSITTTIRHKLTVLTPSYHAESYSPDDNRLGQYD